MQVALIAAVLVIHENNFRQQWQYLKPYTVYGEAVTAQHLTDCMFWMLSLDAIIHSTLLNNLSPKM